jgi:tetratricopeptide (TPR) repeat protein
VKTGKDGTYFQAGAPAGTYRLSVIEKGITLAAADNLVIKLDDRIDQDFDLRKQDQQPAASASELDKAQKEAENRANAETQGAFNAGLAAFDAHNFDEAIKQFSLAAERRPKMPVIFARLGSTYSAAGKFNEAAGAYQKATELNPNNSGYIYSMGIAQCNANHIDECRAAIRKAVEISPALGATAYFTLGTLLVSHGMAKDGDEAFQLSIAHDPNKAESYYQISLLYFSQQATIPNAIPYLEKYLKLAPNGPNAAAAKGLLEAAKAVK